MDFLKTLLAYMGATLVIAVESTSTPSVNPVPTPAPETAAPGPAVVETVTAAPSAEATPAPTVSVTPAPVPTITANVKGYHNLLQGDRGEDVRRLQERLIELGYLPEGSADGAYGAKTRNAVRLFQYYNGLTVDGIAGRMTQTNLFENPDAATMPPKETPTPEPTPTPAPTPEPAPEETEEPEEKEPEETEKPEETDKPEESEKPGEEKPAERGRTGEPEKSAPAEDPTVTPYVVASPTDIPWGDETPKPEENTAEPAAEETEKPDGPEKPEEPEEPEESEKPEEPRETELVENVDLDEEDSVQTPAPTEEPEKTVWEDLAGWIILNEGGGALQWNAEEDGGEAVRSPRMQSSEDEIRVSLDDLAMCLEDWTLHDEGDSLILEAQGYTLALLNEETGFAATVDGMELTTGPDDFSFEDGHFIRVEFLTAALDGAWEWDPAEEILTLRIPGKEAGD